MMLYVQLAVKNRKNAKDGLLQYRNICQVTHIKSLEKVIKEVVRLAELKTTEREAIDAEVFSGVSVTDFDDLELDETLGYRPEVVRFFINGVGGDEDGDRSQQNATPWLKYFWDVLRSVLDVMRNNLNLDTLYHKIVSKALHYCSNYQRRFA